MRKLSYYFLWRQFPLSIENEWRFPFSLLNKGNSMTPKAKTKTKNEKNKSRANQLESDVMW